MHQYKTHIKMETKKQIDVIREKCESEGLNIYDVFREAKVPVVTISNWNRKEPDAFATVNKINEALDKMTGKNVYGSDTRPVTAVVSPSTFDYLAWLAENETDNEKRYIQITNLSDIKEGFQIENIYETENAQDMVLYVKIMKYLIAQLIPTT